MKKVLGLYWNLQKDVSELKSNIVIKSKLGKEPIKTYHAVEDLKRDGIGNLTRRQALSQVNSIYNPLGLAIPFIARTKKLMRKTCNSEEVSDWDDALWDEFATESILLF